MGAFTTPSLMTVEEFDRIPDPPGARLELRHGVPTPVTFPKKVHISLQRQIARLLERVFPQDEVLLELPFRPVAEHELWAADVGVVTTDRWDATEDAGWLAGAPELVVEVVSPSNTAEELQDRERMCFEGRAREFWVVYPKTRTVYVANAAGESCRYGVGQRIPAGSGFIDVGEIFAVLD